MSENLDNIIGFHHVGIVVPDLEDGIEFYTNLLGYSVAGLSSWDSDHDAFNQIIGLERSAARYCMLRGQNSYLELFEYTQPAPMKATTSQANQLGIRHLCIAVRDVDAALERCISLGGSRIGDPVSFPSGPSVTYCRDPFGNLLEFARPGGRFPDAITAIAVRSN